MGEATWKRRAWLQAMAGASLWGQQLGVKVPLPTPMVDSWVDTEGHLHSTAEWRAHKLTALFFITTDCPITNSYVGEMQRFYREYSAKGVLFWGVHCDPTQGENVVKKYVEDFKYEFPVLIDEQLVLATRFGAKRMPECAIVSPDAKLVYRGRIDDRYVSFGKSHVEASKHDFRDAMERALGGDLTKVVGKEPVGCYIPFSMVRKALKG